MEIPVFHVPLSCFSSLVERTFLCLEQGIVITNHHYTLYKVLVPNVKLTKAERIYLCFETNIIRMKLVRLLNVFKGFLRALKVILETGKFWWYLTRGHNKIYFLLVSPHIGCQVETHNLELRLECHSALFCSF